MSFSLGLLVRSSWSTLVYNYYSASSSSSSYCVVHLCCSCISLRVMRSAVAVSCCYCCCCCIRIMLRSCLGPIISDSRCGEGDVAIAVCSLSTCIYTSLLPRTSSLAPLLLSPAAEILIKVSCCYCYLLWLSSPSLVEVEFAAANVVFIMSSFHMPDY